MHQHRLCVQEFQKDMVRQDFKPTALIFPTEGCWEVTGKVGETSLTFVTRVVKIEER